MKDLMKSKLFKAAQQLEKKRLLLEEEKKIEAEMICSHRKGMVWDEECVLI